MRRLTVGSAALTRRKPDLAAPSDTPSHARIEKWLADAIASGRLHPDDRLPPEPELAAALGVSRMTLRQALSTLEHRDLLIRKRGRFGGNFIASPRLDFDLTGLPGFTEQMRRLRVEAGARVVSAMTRRANAEQSRALEITRGAQVHEIVRVRLANRLPMALEETYFPAATFENLLSHPLTGSLYAVLESEYGKVPSSANETLEPVIATARHAELLDVAEGAPLMLLSRTSYTSSGLPVEHSYDYFRPDRTRITLRVSVEEDQPGHS
ncbi:MAG: GntR family transcriptional regulator [Nocardioidaceae bacterium]